MVVSSPLQRTVLLRRAIALSMLSIVLSGLLGGVGIVAAVASNSLSLLGFAADAAIDAVASIALVWRLRVEAREPARAVRVEHLAERIVGVVLLVLGAYIAFGAVRALIDGSHPETTTAGTALLALSVVVLPPLAIAKNRLSSKLQSGALRADSVLTAIAALLALISLVGNALSQAFDIGWADAVAALAVALIIGREGWSSSRARLIDDSV